MATVETILGKKIDQLDEIPTITDDTVLPAVLIDNGIISQTAGKVPVRTIKTVIQSGMLLTPNVVTDLAVRKVELAKLSENTIYQYGQLDSLTVTEAPISYFETVIYFSSGAAPTQVNLDSNLIWINEPLETEANKNYVISICNGMAVYGSD